MLSIRCCRWRSSWSSTAFSSFSLCFRSPGPTCTHTCTHSIRQTWAPPLTPIALHNPHNFLYFPTRTSSHLSSQHTLPSVWLHSAAAAIVVVSLLSFRLHHQYLWFTCVLLPPRLCVIFCDLNETELGPSSDFLQRFACFGPNNSTVKLFWNIEAVQGGFSMKPLKVDFWSAAVHSCCYDKNGQEKSWNRKRESRYQLSEITVLGILHSRSDSTG